jgi:hypothetical protein
LFLEGRVQSPAFLLAGIGIDAFEARHRASRRFSCTVPPSPFHARLAALETLGRGLRGASGIGSNCRGMLATVSSTIL